MYLRERIAQGANDPTTKAIYEGLLDVLDPPRRATRLQREMAAAAKAAVVVKPAAERRAAAERGNATTVKTAELWTSRRDPRPDAAVPGG